MFSLSVLVPWLITPVKYDINCPSVLFCSDNRRTCWVLSHCISIKYELLFWGFFYNKKNSVLFRNPNIHQMHVPSLLQSGSGADRIPLWPKCVFTLDVCIWSPLEKIFRTSIFAACQMHNLHPARFCNLIVWFHYFGIGVSISPKAYILLWEIKHILCSFLKRIINSFSKLLLCLTSCLFMLLIWQDFPANSKKHAVHNRVWCRCLVKSLCPGSCHSPTSLKDVSQLCSSWVALNQNLERMRVINRKPKV